MDVEAVASGPGHKDRVPAWVAVVDGSGATILDRIISVDTIFSPLTMVTGLTLEDIKTRGAELTEVLAAVRAELGSDVVLVGQNVQSDVDWLGLRPGIDFMHLVDLSEVFKVWNPRFSRWDRFGLAQEAYGLLGFKMQGEGAHSPVVDAQVSVRLYQEWVLPAEKADEGTQILQQMRLKKQFESLHNPIPPTVDGVCMRRFTPSECSCGQKADLAEDNRKELEAEAEEDVVIDKLRKRDEQWEVVATAVAKEREELADEVRRTTAQPRCHGPTTLRRPPSPPTVTSSSTDTLSLAGMAPQEDAVEKMQKKEVVAAEAKQHEERRRQEEKRRRGEVERREEERKHEEERSREEERKRHEEEEMREAERTREEERRRLEEEQRRKEEEKELAIVRQKAEHELSESEWNRGIL